MRSANRLRHFFYLTFSPLVTSIRHTISGIGSPCRTLSFAVALLSTFPIVRISSADLLEISEKPPFERINITGFVDERIVFRGLSGETVRVSARRATLIQLDRAPAFSKAELARTRGAWDEALASYASSLHDEPPGAFHDLFLLRRIECLELSGRFAEAVEEWADLLQKSPSLALIATPRQPQPPGSQANLAARERVQGVVRQLTRPEAAGALQTARRFLLELLIFDEVNALPADYQPPVPASQPLLFARPDRSGPRIELPPDSFVFEAANAAIQRRDFNRAVSLLGAALPYCPATGTDTRRLALARARIEIGQYATAINELMALVDAPDRDQAAQAMYHVGLAHQRLGRPDTARRYYQLALDCRELPESLRTAAREALQKIGD